jgi:hypothetical protein
MTIGKETAISCCLKGNTVFGRLAAMDESFAKVSDKLV